MKKFIEYIMGLFNKKEKPVVIKLIYVSENEEEILEDVEGIRDIRECYIDFFKENEKHFQIPVEVEAIIECRLPKKDEDELVSSGASNG